MTCTQGIDWCPEHAMNCPVERVERVGTHTDWAQATTHTLKWWVFDGYQFTRHTHKMTGSWPGWGVSCSCGWSSVSNGQIKRRVVEAARDHKWCVEQLTEHPDAVGVARLMESD